jgi:hypothetical protein
MLEPYHIYSNPIPLLFLTLLPCSGFSSLQGLILMKVFAMNRSCLCNESKWGMILHVDIPIISENVEDLHD